MCDIRCVTRRRRGELYSGAYTQKTKQKMHARAYKFDLEDIAVDFFVAAHVNSHTITTASFKNSLDVLCMCIGWRIEARAHTNRKSFHLEGRLAECAGCSA